MVSWMECKRINLLSFLFGKYAECIRYIFVPPPSVLIANCKQLIFLALPAAGIGRLTVTANHRSRKGCHSGGDLFQQHSPALEDSLQKFTLSGSGCQ